MDLATWVQELFILHSHIRRTRDVFRDSKIRANIILNSDEIGIKEIDAQDNEL